MGKRLLDHLLQAFFAPCLHFNRGISRTNIFRKRAFYIAYAKYPTSVRQLNKCPPDIVATAKTTESLLRSSQILIEQ